VHVNDSRLLATLSQCNLLVQSEVLTLSVVFNIVGSEVNAGFFYHDAEQREKMVAAERRNVDEKVHKIIELKRKVSLLSVHAVCNNLQSSSFY
jgi:hypothetical protein